MRRGLGLPAPQIAKSSRRAHDAAVRKWLEALLSVIGLAAVPSLVLLFDYAKMPPQPEHPATARVVAIVAWEAKFRVALDTVSVRNAGGTGQFSIREADVRCHVGDIVPVEQQGVTLTPAAGTCR